MLDLKSNLDEGIASLLDRAHLRDTVTDLDLMCQLLVFRDGGVPSVSHGPFINTELQGCVSKDYHEGAMGYSLCLRA